MVSLKRRRGASKLGALRPSRCHVEASEAWNPHRGFGKFQAEGLAESYEQDVATHWPRPRHGRALGAPWQAPTNCRIEDCGT